MKVAIIGGGASGLMVGGQLSHLGYEVTIFDGNEKAGKKIYITGKGRCNVTNNCSPSQVRENIVHGDKFMFSALNLFPPEKTIEFFEDLGVKLKTERGNRVFPESDKASDITKALVKNAQECTFRFDERVLKITKSGETFIIKTLVNEYEFDRVVVATGGKSYPATGSRGDGYEFARSFGHEVVPPHGALVPIKLADGFAEMLEGLSLKNVTLKAKIDGNEKALFGEMLFTNDALSGPIALSLSSYIGQSKKVELSVDFKPALSENQVDARLLRDFDANKNCEILTIMRGLLPERLAKEFLLKLKIDSTLKVHSISKELREKITKSLKNFQLAFGRLYPVEAGIVTSGGVSLNEINPKTMESKLVKGLYFVGEVLNIDCLTGGFNLQCAFSTAYACAYNFQ